MHIYLSHPKHGSKVAISDMEAAFDERNGWKRYTPSDAPAVDSEPVNNLVTAPTAPQRRRRAESQGA